MKIQCEEKSPRGALKALPKLKEELGIRAIWGPVGGAYLLPARRPPRPAEETRRVGLALTPHKTAAPGHLYAATSPTRPSTSSTQTTSPQASPDSAEKEGSP
ncbi:MAG: hypothetical protein QW247_11995 [Pyrobaculum sp.]